jgi:hypothetical protein
MKTAILKRRRAKLFVNEEIINVKSNFKLHISTFFPEFTYIDKKGKLITSKNNIVI